ncbi:hypothetical protein BRADI_2g20377v3 [Brachypodium distachyon]|uniref:Uncharacterized protein n=1 Tax=Brachypodium distachyon TaxID=15368 RepID=A0A2K2D9K1_BRADI|nr:hypothetical protein BRADI_2g20377v3 [Brachypodium distachyon]
MRPRISGHGGGPHDGPTASWRFPHATETRGPRRWRLCCCERYPKLQAAGTDPKIGSRWRPVVLHRCVRAKEEEVFWTIGVQREKMEVCAR